MNLLSCGALPQTPDLLMIVLAARFLHYGWPRRDLRQFRWAAWGLAWEKYQGTFNLCTNAIV